MSTSTNISPAMLFFVFDAAHLIHILSVVVPHPVVDPDVDGADVVAAAAGGGLAKVVTHLVETYAVLFRPGGKIKSHSKTS